MITTIVGRPVRERNGHLVHKYITGGKCSVKGCPHRDLLRSTFSNKILCGKHREKELEPYMEKKAKAYIYRLVNGKEHKAKVGPVLAPSAVSLVVGLTQYAQSVGCANWVRDPNYMCGGYYTNEDFTKPRIGQQIHSIYLKGW